MLATLVPDEQLPRAEPAPVLRGVDADHDELGRQQQLDPPGSQQERLDECSLAMLIGRILSLEMLSGASCTIQRRYAIA